MEGWTDGQMDGQIQWTDTPSHKDAWTHLKMIYNGMQSHGNDTISVVLALYYNLAARERAGGHARVFGDVYVCACVSISLTLVTASPQSCLYQPRVFVCVCVCA